MNPRPLGDPGALRAAAGQLAACAMQLEAIIAALSKKLARLIFQGPAADRLREECGEKLKLLKIQHSNVLMARATLIRSAESLQSELRLWHAQQESLRSTREV